MMIDLERGVLEEFAACSHPPTTRQRDGRFVERSRPSRPTAYEGVVPMAVLRFETQRMVTAAIAGRRIARRRMVWVPT